MSNVTELNKSKANHPAGKKRGPKPGNPNHPMKVQAARRQEEQDRIKERYERQEAKRAVPVQPDTNKTLTVALVLGTIAVITSGVISFNGITSISALVGLSAGWMAYMFFGFIEVLIGYFTVNYVIRSSRATETGGQVTAAGDFWGLVVFSSIAILGNAYHTLSFHEWNFVSPDTWAGVVLSATAPAAVIWVTKSASSTLFAKPVRLS